MITQPTEEYFKDGLWGWDGTRWRKLPLLWGYSDRLAEQKKDLSAAVGTNQLVHTAVPVGEVWKVTLHTVNNANTAVNIQLRGNLGGTDMLIYNHGVPAAGAWNTSLPLDLTFKAGDVIYGQFVACVLNDDIYSHLFGYKMAVV